MTTFDSVTPTQIKEQSIQRLRDDIYIFAQEIEGGVGLTLREMQERYGKIIGNPNFSRELLVQTIEDHDDKLSMRVRYLMIDNVDLIVSMRERNIDIQPPIE